MDNQHLVLLARQFGGENARGRRPGRLQRLSRGRLLQLLGKQRKRKTEAALAFQSQASFANSTGRNRTKDFLIPDSVGARPRGGSGRGQWKKWTPEAVLRAAFSNESMAARHVAEQVDGGSASHATQCKLYIANLILQGQQDGLEKFLREHKAQNGEDAIQFALTNCIFDETELEINLHEFGLGEWSILASHSQLTFKVGQTYHDYDVIRLPQALPNKTAATMWPALCGDGSVGGLWPGLSRVPAKIRAVLVTCDAAPANVKLLGHLSSVLDERTLLLPFLCLQHRTGNVIEKLTKLTGSLTGCYAISKTMRSGAVVKRLTASVRRELSQSLMVTDQVPAGCVEEWASGRACAEAILRLAFAEEEKSKMGLVMEFLDFFAGPWTGLSLGEYGVCGRAVSLGFSFRFLKEGCIIVSVGLSQHVI